MNEQVQLTESHIEMLRHLLTRGDVAMLRTAARVMLNDIDLTAERRNAVAQMLLAEIERLHEFNLASDKNLKRQIRSALAADGPPSM